MALALNVFKTVTSVVGVASTAIYTAPVGYTGVVLLAQVTNVGSTSQDVSFTHRRSSTDTEILKQFPISGNDTANLLAGKLVLESGDRLVLSGSNATNLKFIASVLETLN
jgi:fructose-1-phosphate kinase PfkB-like protein